MMACCIFKWPVFQRIKKIRRTKSVKNFHREWLIGVIEVGHRLDF